MSSGSHLLGFCLLAFAALFYVEAQVEEVDLAPNWPWEKPHTFVCPASFGTYPDPDDCSSYFVCAMKIASHRTCRRLTLFDVNLKKCVSFLIAVCDDSGKSKTTTITPKTTTPDDSKGFVCPSLVGSFLHPTDCTKYYTCTFFLPSLKTCPDKELFDGVKKECKPAKDVHCGTRTRPTDETTIPTETTTTTPEDTTTTPQPTSPAPPEPEPTTTPKPRVTAPDTDCDEDDLDCIIDDLGETPDWFVCETDMGSYPHPTSRKLFIFCLNWKPAVKKCGQDLVFSEELMTCVNP